MKYRRKNGSDTWHWCTNCPNWPTSDYVEQDGKPSSGELDNTCRSLESKGDCNNKN